MVLAGVAVSAVALFVAYGALPLVHRWTQREGLIAASAERLGRLHSLIDRENQLRTSIRAREADDAGARRLIAGRTPALAGAALQTAIQAHAQRSRVTINRLDVAGAPDTAATILPMIPASLSAIGDIHGVSEFLSLLDTGTPVVEIREMTVVSNSSLRDGLLQLSLTMRAPSVIE